MRCPYCNHSDSKVLESRETEDGRVIRRRRACEKCRARFSTYEQVELLKLLVLKKDGKKEEYRKEKLEESIRRAINKRLNEDQLAEIVSGIEAEIHVRGNSEISSKDIGEIALKKLKEKDEVSYLRFASVFKSFGSGKRFVKELNKLEKESQEKELKT